MFDGYSLEVILESEPVSVYRLLPPGGGYAQSVELVFTDTRIGITGDLCPGGRYGNAGVWSAYGYGPGWFSAQLSAAYLAEKFPEVRSSQRRLLVEIQAAFRRLYPTRSSAVPS